MFSILSWIRWNCNILICSKSQGNNYSQRYDHRRQIKHLSLQFSSVAQFCLTLWPHELQHTRPPCPSPRPGVYSNSCPLSWWCHPTFSSSVVPFSSCLQSSPASGSFPMSQLFAWGGQRIGVSASASVLPMDTQDWFPLGWTSWISLQLVKNLPAVWETWVRSLRIFHELGRSPGEGKGYPLQYSGLENPMDCMSLKWNLGKQAVAFISHNSNIWYWKDSSHLLQVKWF